MGASLKDLDETRWDNRVKRPFRPLKTGVPDRSKGYAKIMGLVRPSQGRSRIVSVLSGIK